MSTPKSTIGTGSKVTILSAVSMHPFASVISTKYCQVESTGSVEDVPILIKELGVGIPEKGGGVMSYSP